MKVGYARVSTKDQNLEMQINALEEVGCKNIFTDKLSGKNTQRTGLQEAINFLRKGDTLIVYKLDRLSRSLADLIKIVNEINSKGSEFSSISEKIDTETPGGKLIFHIFSALAQFERELIVERTKVGLEAARKQGRIGGRPRAIDSNTLDQITRMKKAGISVKTISKQINISVATIYRYLDK